VSTRMFWYYHTMQGLTPLVWLYHACHAAERALTIRSAHSIVRSRREAAQRNDCVISVNDPAIL